VTRRGRSLGARDLASNRGNQPIMPRWAKGGDWAISWLKHKLPTNARRFHTRPCASAASSR
jgi:hypothetical protein